MVSQTIVKLQVLGLSLGVDFTFALDNNDNNNNNNNNNDNNPHLNFFKGRFVGSTTTARTTTTTKATFHQLLTRFGPNFNGRFLD